MSEENLSLTHIIEALLLVADEPLSEKKMLLLLEEQMKPPTVDELREAISALQEDCEKRCVELKSIASGYQLQVKSAYSPYVRKLWQEKPPKYSKAILETIALVAYRQPITRGEIEEVRGVAVSSHIIKTLLERQWVRVVGHKDVPGKPALYATTKQFLDYFNLESLTQLPSLAELQDIVEQEKNLQAQLDLEDMAEGSSFSRLASSLAEEELNPEEGEDIYDEENQAIEEEANDAQAQAREAGEETEETGEEAEEIDQEAIASEESIGECEEERDVEEADANEERIADYEEARVVEEADAYEEHIAEYEEAQVAEEADANEERIAEYEEAQVTEEADASKLTEFARLANIVEEASDPIEEQTQQDDRYETEEN